MYKERERERNILSAVVELAGSYGAPFAREREREIYI